MSCQNCETQEASLYGMEQALSNYRGGVAITCKYLEKRKCRRRWVFFNLHWLNACSPMRLRGDKAADWRIKVELDAKHCQSIFKTWRKNGINQKYLIQPYRSRRYKQCERCKKAVFGSGYKKDINVNILAQTGLARLDTKLKFAFRTTKSLSRVG